MLGSYYMAVCFGCTGLWHVSHVSLKARHGKSWAGLGTTDRGSVGLLGHDMASKSWAGLGTTDRGSVGLLGHDMVDDDTHLQA